MRYAALAFSVLLLLPAGVANASDPPVRLKLSDQTLARGQSEKIHVRVAADGYLLVLRTDTQGNIRVVFPLNPTDDASIHAGKNVEIRGRGDRDAFAAFENPGSGMVLAAWADHPFNFDAFATNGHWTRAGLVADSAGTDAESAMLGIVDQMSDGHYEYDVLPYSVGNRQYRRDYADRYDPWWYSPWFDPWYYGPLAGPWYPYGYGPRFGFGIVVRPRFGGGRRFR